jgi:hypothetical protein
MQPHLLTLIPKVIFTLNTHPSFLLYFELIYVNYKKEQIEEVFNIFKMRYMIMQNGLFASRTVNVPILYCENGPGMFQENVPKQAYPYSCENEHSIPQECTKLQVCLF